MIMGKEAAEEWRRRQFRRTKGANLDNDGAGLFQFLIAFIAFIVVEYRKPRFDTIASR